MFILLPAAYEMKREEGSEGKKGQEGDGQCPAEVVLLSFPVLTGKLVTPDHRQPTSKLGARASEIKRPICNSHLLGMAGEQSVQEMKYLRHRQQLPEDNPTSW